MEQENYVPRWKIDLESPFRRVTMIDAIKEVTGVDFHAIETDEQAQEAAKKLNVEIDPIKTSRGDIIVQIFDEKLKQHWDNQHSYMNTQLKIHHLLKMQR